jgi:hypothetical protein
MRFSMGRGVLRLVLVGVVFVGVSATLAAMPADRPEVGAFRWVRALDLAARNHYLQDAVLRSLPFEYRRALVASLPTPQRAAFWRRAFAAYRDAHDLLPEQVDVLNRAIQQTTPEALNGSGDSIAAWTGLEASLRKPLGAAGANELFYAARMTRSQTSELPNGERIAYAWRHLRARLMATVGRRTSDEVPCNCSGENDCDPDMYCAPQSTQECTPVPGCSGAGHTCSGYCLPDPSAR